MVRKQRVQAWYVRSASFAILSKPAKRRRHRLYLLPPIIVPNSRTCGLAHMDFIASRIATLVSWRWYLKQLSSCQVQILAQTRLGK